MDSERSFYLPLLQNPEELNSGNDAVNLRVLHVSKNFSVTYSDYLGNQSCSRQAACGRTISSSIKFNMKLLNDKKKQHLKTNRLIKSHKKFPN